jgi:holliday junction DNA helicase RuvA
MIGQLRGALVDKRPNQIIVDVAGVGYQVQVPLSTFTGLGALHTEITLLIHTHLREDQIALYGFLTAREKQCFELLISATGVGPNLALKILSGMSLDELVPAVRKGDILQLRRIPGVGQKTAERIVVELRDKLVAVEVAEPSKPSPHSQVEADVSSALVNLGYEPRAVEKTIAELRGQSLTFDTLLRGALQELGGAAIEKGARAAGARIGQ